MICSGKVWLTQTLIFLWLYDFIHHLHCMKHLEVCIFKCNTPHGCRVDFSGGGRRSFTPSYFFAPHAPQSKRKWLQPSQECCCHLLRKARLSTFSGGTEAAASSRTSRTHISPNKIESFGWTRLICKWVISKITVIKLKIQNQKTYV